MAVKLETKYAKNFIRSDEILALQPQVTLAHDTLHAGTGLKTIVSVIILWKIIVFAF